MSFVGLYTGLSGLRAGQVGIDTSANNIANASTPGYTRQRVELAPSHSYDSPVGRLGTGVDVISINRLRDAFLDARARGANADAAATSTHADVLRTLEELTGEPDQGVATRLGALWTSLESWANDPADTASRRQVLTDLQAVGQTLRSVSSQWDTLEADLQVRAATGLTTVDQALDRLVDLDRRIASSDPSRIGPELLDQRDLLLDEIAWHTGATARIGPDGRSEVTLGGVSLIEGNVRGTLTRDADGTWMATDPAGNDADVTSALGGELGGLARGLADLTDQRTTLDAFAAEVADQVNAINTGGVRADGTPGEALLAFDPDDPAGTLALLTTDPAALAAAVAGDPPAPHDGSNARRFADLRLGAPDGGPSLDVRHADLVTGLAGQVRSANAASSAARSVASQASTARAAEHGVSLDEEMVSLVRHQRALEAASRVMTTVDEALNVLVNRTGIVGR